MAEADSGAAIQQFSILASTSRGKGVVTIIQQALSHPHVFVFGELLDIPSVQQLAETSDKATLELLQIFAYHTYSQYLRLKESNSLPALSPAQASKLKKLTIVSLSSKQKVIPYSILLKELDINNLRELEDLIIDCIYQGIIKGRLDQQNQHLEIDFAIGRDLQPGELESMIVALSDWCNRSELLLGKIEEKINYASVHHAQNKSNKLEYEKRIDDLKAILKAASDDGDNDMLSDEERKKRGGNPRKAQRKNKGGPMDARSLQ